MPRSLPLPVQCFLTILLAVALLPGYAQSVQDFAGLTAPHFIPNKGQVTDTKGNVREGIQFYWKGKEKAIFFRESGVSYVFYEHKQNSLKISEATLEKEKRDIKPGKIKSYRLDVRFKGGETAPKITGKDKIATRYNYYQPHCANGITNINGYRKIVYRNVYPGIDMVYYFVPGDDGRFSLKYDLVVRPKGHYRDIKLAYVGAKQLLIGKNGDLTALTPLGNITEQAPVVLQNGKEKPCRFSLEGNRLSFEVEDIDPSQKYTIDPLIRNWATLFGGSSNELGNDVSVDEQGNAYITGYTTANNNNQFPATTGAFQTSSGGGTDAFLAKFDTTGSLVWCTFYGGNLTDNGEAVSVGKKAVYITGWTQGGGFPVSSGAWQSTSLGGYSNDAFLVKFDTSGSRSWGTFLGGSNEEYGNDLAVNQQGGAYLTGQTRSADFPDTNGFQNSFGGFRDAFMAKFDSSGDADWVTYYGGSGGERGTGVAIKANGDIAFSGATKSTDFPVTNDALQDTLNATGIYSPYDAFIVELDSLGNQIWSSYLGGSSAESDDYNRPVKIITDNQNNLYLALTTASSDMPITGNSYQDSMASFLDLYIAKINSNYKLSWSTYLGGAGSYNGNYLGDLTWGKGSFYLTGRTEGGSFPTTQYSFQTNYSGGFNDVFISEFGSDGNLLFSTLYGSGDNERGDGIAYDDQHQRVLVTGSNKGSYSDLFPTTSGVFDRVNNNGRDAFLLRFRECLFDTEITADTSSLHCPGDSIILQADSLYNAGYTWSNGDTTQKTWVHEAGEYWVQVIDTSGCAGYDTVNIKKVPDSLDKPVSSFYPTVTQTAETAGVVKLEWDTVPNNPYTKFLRLYYRHADSAGFSLLKDSIALSDTQYTHTSLNTRNKVHSYYLTPYFSCGEKADSVTIFQTINLQFTLGQLTHNLSWNKFKGWDSFRYFLQERQGGQWVNRDTLSPTDTNLTKFPAPCNYYVTYRLAAKDSLGWYSYSDTVSLQAIDSIPPDGPAIINASVIDSLGTAITFQAADSQDIFRFDVRRLTKSSSTLAGTVLYDSANATHQFIDSGYIPNNRYCYTVNSVDTCYNVTSIDTFCPVYLKGNVRNLANQLYWHRFDGYPIDSQFVLKFNGTDYDTLARLNGSDTTYTDTGLRCNRPYSYKVLSFEQGGNRQTLSDSVKLTPFDTLKPAAPHFRRATVQNSDSVEITWNTSSDIDVNRYEVFYARRGGAFQSLGILSEKPKAVQSFVQDTVNLVKQSYCYYVEAIDSCSDVHSLPSDTHCVMQLEAKGGQRESHVYWQPYIGAKVDSYAIESYDGGTWKQVGKVAGNDTSFTDTTSVNCGNNYPYRIQAQWQDGSNFTSLSDTAQAIPFDTVNPQAPEIRRFSVTGPDSAQLTWDLSDGDVKSYELSIKGSVSNSAVGSWQVVDTVGVDSSYTFGNLNTTDSIYCARIVAIDSCAANRSGFSQKHCAVQLEGTAGNLETDLNWHPYEGFFNPTYHIQRKTSNTSWQTLGSKTDTNFNDTQALACNVTYTYRIRTVSPSGNDTSYSDTLNLQPFDTTAPPVPQLRFASANLQEEVELEWEWDTKSDQKYFEIWRDQGNGNYAIQDTITYDSTYLDVSTNPNQTPRAYFVRAIDSCSADGTIGAPGNRSIPSDTDRIMVPEVATGACQPEARLSWTPYEDLPQGTDYYKIYRQQPATNNIFQQVGTSPDTNFTDTTILDGNGYCYRIEAVDTQSAYTAFSDSLCMQPFVYPIPDTARIKRTTVEETGQSNGEILVEWERAPKSDTFARGYYIYHRKNGGNYQLIANISDLGDTTYRHRGINTAKFPHEYRVVIYNLCLEDGGYRKVHRPVKLYGENRNLEVALDWLPYQGFDVQKYEVQRSVNGGPYRSLDTLMSSDTSYRDSSVRCGNQYAYRIYAEGSKRHEQSLSDSIGFVAYDTIPPDRAGINRGTILETSATNGIAEVSFEPASQANRKGYIFYRSEDNSRFVPVDTVFSNSTTTITYNDSNLNTQYSILGYYIRSFDSCGNVAAPSDIHQLINLQAEAKNLANQIEWTAYQGWNGWLYELQRRRPNTNWTTIARQDTGNRTFTDSTKNCDTLYYYRVKAINANTGGVSFSNYDTVTSIDQEPPQPPQPERVTVEADGSVRIEWKASISPDAANTNMFKKPASNPNFEPKAINLQTTNYTDSQSNANEEPISYRLRSEDSCNNVSDPSEIHTTIHLKAKPGQEQNELTWSAYEGWDVANYEVYKDGNQLTEVDGDQLSYKDARAVCTTYHNYRVRAIKESGEEIFSWSNTDSAQARDNTPPQAVNLNTATVVEPNEVVEVRWEVSSDYDADGYEIYRSGLNSTGLIQIATIEDAETTRFRDSLSNPTNQQFCYQVRVRDFCDNSSKRSNNGCVMGIEGEAIEGANTISWDEYYEWPGNIAYYNIYKKEDSSFYEQIGRTTETNYRDENLKNRVTDFCYQVEAHHSEGDETSRSFEFCLRQPQIVYIPNSFTPGITEGQNDKFGPEGLYIENYEMTIFNRWGEEIFSTESGEPWNGTYEGQPAPAGIYLYSITVIGENGRRESYKGSVTVVR